MSLSPRDTFVRYLDPLKIIWEDAEGNPHFSIEDALKAFDLPDTPEHREAVTAIIQDAIRAQNPDAVFIKRAKPDSPEYFKQ